MTEAEKSKKACIAFYSNDEIVFKVFLSLYFYFLLKLY